MTINELTNRLIKQLAWINGPEQIIFVTWINGLKTELPIEQIVGISSTNKIEINLKLNKK